LQGYGPDVDEGTPTFDDLSSALEYARDDLSVWIDMAHEAAHSFAADGQFEDAWKEILRCEDLELWRANLDPARRDAPLYKDDPAAYAAMQSEQAAQFPRDVSYNSRLYLWDCDESDCEEEL
jgi:hypothetical protein